MLTSCVSAAPTETPTHSKPHPSTSVATTTIPGTTTTTIVEPSVVATSFPQSGVAAPLWDDHQYGEPAFAASLIDIADAGAHWVTLVPTWYQTDTESSTIFAEIPGRTATDEALVMAIRGAHQNGLAVMLKPHLDLVEGGSRALIEPVDLEGWFGSYGEMILAYAELAEVEGVEQFVVGTELGGVSGDSEHWRALVSEVRDIFGGPVTYAANHNEFENVDFWDALDFVGIDAYFSLSKNPTTDIDALRAAWDPIIERIGETAERVDRVVVFTEVGYPSQEGASVEPYNPFYSKTPSEEEQAAALQSMLDATEHETWFGGFHWWMWFVARTSDGAALSYMPKGKLAGSILTDYWGRE